MIYSSLLYIVIRNLVTYMLFSPRAYFCFIYFRFSRWLWAEISVGHEALQLFITMLANCSASPVPATRCWH